MNLIFIDVAGYVFDVSTPGSRPLGGSQSAACYLSAELARRGHRVVVVSGLTQDREVMGVRCVSLGTFTTDLLTQPWDAMVAINGLHETRIRIRPHLHPATPLVLWTQHAHNQRAMAGFLTSEDGSGWDGVVFVSDWQRSMFIRHFHIDPARSCVLRNAVAPAFEGMFGCAEELVRARRSRPVLAYTSTPFRGLDLLVDMFPAIRDEHPDAELRVYSSMQVYQKEEHEDKYAALYQRCRSIPGIRYMGLLPQSQLPSALREVSVLSYTNTFPETSCIAVMEALAAGACVVTSDLGALRETTMGFARLVPARGLTKEQYAPLYLEHLREVLRQHQDDPAAFAAARWEQVLKTNADCTWSQRATQWEHAVPAWREWRR